MARLLVHRNEVRKEFSDGVVWVTVGEDATGPELAEKVINLVSLLGADRPALTDPLAAGAELGRVLGDRRVLLEGLSGVVVMIESSVGFRVVPDGVPWTVLAPQRKRQRT